MDKNNRKAVISTGVASLRVSVVYVCVYVCVCVSVCVCVGYRCTECGSAGRPWPSEPRSAPHSRPSSVDVIKESDKGG